MYSFHPLRDDFLYVDITLTASSDLSFQNRESPATGVKMEGEKRSVPGFRSV